MSIDIRKEMKVILPHLKKAQEDNLNEADTVLRIIKVLEGVLGYDGLSEITKEQQIKDKYCDMAIKVDGVIKFLIEAKAAGVVLRDRHIEQCQRYASEGNIRWALLTNGVVWNLYHLTFEEGIEYERAFTVDLMTDPLDKACGLLSLLHRKSLVRGELETYWTKRVALGAHSIARVLFYEDTLMLIRREIRRLEGINIDIEDLGTAIQSILSPEAREQIGPFKIRKKKSPTKKPKTAGIIVEETRPHSEGETAMQSPTTLTENAII